MVRKYLGYILLIAGLVLIGWTLWQSYNIFTAKTDPPLVFKTSSDVSGSILQNIPQQFQSQVQDLIQSQVGQVLPTASITKVLNLTSWSLFAFVLIIAGGVLSGIGVKLIKK